MIFCVFLSYYANILLVRAAQRTQNYTYIGIARKLYGTKVEFVVKVIYFLGLWGATSVAYILSNNLFGKSAEEFFGDSAPAWLTSTSGYFWPPVYTTLIIFPLSLPREINALRFVYLLGLVFVLYYLIAVIIESTKSDVCPIGDNFRFILQPSNLFRWKGFSIMAPMCVYSFVCQVNTLYVYSELNRPSIRRMKKVLKRTMGVCFIIYVLGAFFGYLTFANAIGELENEGNLFLMKGYGGQTLMTVAMVLFNLQNIITMPLATVPCKDALYDILFPNKIQTTGYHQRDDSYLQNFLMVAFCVFTPMVAAMFVPNIATSIGFLGSTISPLICFVLPALYYRKCLKPSERFERWWMNVFIFLNLAFIIYATVTQITYTYD